MMPPIISLVWQVLILYLFASETAWAQALPFLKLQPDRIHKAQRLEQKAIANNDSLLLTEAWYQYGETYELVGNNQMAEPYFLKALRLLEPKGDSYKLIQLYFRLSEVELRQEHFREALNYAIIARQSSQRIQSRKGLIEAYRILGHVREFIWNGRTNGADYDSVFSCYRKSEILSEQVNDTLGIAEANAFIGTLFLRRNDPGAIPHLKKALLFFTLKQDIPWQVRTYIHLSTAYLNTGRLPLAWEMLELANSLYEQGQVNEHGIQAMLEDRFLAYYKKTGQWEKALDHSLKLNELEKHQLLADRNGAMARLNIEYETEKKEVLLKADSQNLRLQQRFTMAASALFLVSVGMSIVFFRLYRKNQRISRRNEVLLKEQNHRVKNNLQVVSSLLSLQAKRLSDETAKKAVDESRLRIESMAIIHRKLYDGDKLAEVVLDEFIPELVGGVLKSYGYSHIKTSYSIDNIILVADKAIPLGLILNELTTNACKYAFPDNDNPIFAIVCQKKDTHIELSVVDNGYRLSNMDLESTRRRTASAQTVISTPKGSLGMTLIRAQVAQLKGSCRFSLGDEAGLMGSVPKGAMFTMEFKI